MRDFIAPEMVLGKTVLDAGGAALGEVQDVGVSDRRRVKFLVVGEGRTLVRVDALDVDAIGDDSVTLRRVA